MKINLSNFIQSLLIVSKNKDCTLSGNHTEYDLLLTNLNYDLLVAQFEFSHSNTSKNLFTVNSKP